MFIGSTAGGLLPALFSSGSEFSYAGIIGSTIGGLVGIWGGWKLSQMV
jgi:hypothetical protein